MHDISMRSAPRRLDASVPEAVADARRMPRMEGFVHGQRLLLQEAQSGPLAQLPELPREMDAASTAAYVAAVLAGSKPVPGPIARQVQHLLHLVQQIEQAAATAATAPALAETTP